MTERYSFDLCNNLFVKRRNVRKSDKIEFEFSDRPLMPADGKFQITPTFVVGIVVSYKVSAESEIYITVILTCLF